MKLYIADYHADTTHLSRDEHGAYLLLIMAMWRAGGKLPNTPHKLAKIAKCTADEWPSMWETLSDFFQIRGGIIRQARLSKEIEKYDAVVLRSQAGGKASAAKKRNEHNELDSTKRARKFNQPEPEPEPDITSNEVIGDHRNIVPLKPDPKGSRLPEEWIPNANYVAGDFGLTHEQHATELFKFRDYWRAVPGAKGRKLDWDGTWRNWMRRASDDLKSRNQRNGQSPDAKHNAKLDNFERAATAPIPQRGLFGA